jgi:hypothetical protein
MKSEMSAGLTMLSKTMEAQERARTGMLAALTPAHRDLLARIVGELAVAPDPHFDAAAAQIDAALNPGEVQAIKSLEAEKRAQTILDASQMQSTLQNSLPPEQAKQMQQDAAAQSQSLMANGGSSVIAQAARLEGDPGHVLLLTVLLGMQPANNLLRLMGAPTTNHP